MKTIQIRIKKGNADTTISIKESILNLYRKVLELGLNQEKKT